MIYGLVARYDLSLSKSFEYTLVRMQVLNPVYYLTGSASGQSEAIPVFWLLPEGKGGPIFADRDFPLSSLVKTFSWAYNKSFIDQDCSVEIAGYWTRI